MKSPAEYAATGNEDSEQVALFCWAAMAARFGLTAADDPDSYSVPGVAIAHAAKYHDEIPELDWLFAIHNAGHGDAIRGARAKAAGVRPGVPDVCLPVSRWGWAVNSVPPCAACGLYIELKRKASKAKARRAGVASAKQLDWGDFLSSQCYEFHVCVGWQSARDRIVKYLGLSDVSQGIS